MPDVLQHTAKLTVGAARQGVELTNFDELDVSIDMLAPGSPWTVTFWFTSGDPRVENDFRRVRRLCNLEETVRVYLDETEQLHGRIERVSLRTTPEGRSLTISGRDLAARAMTSDASPGLELKGRQLGDALQDLFRDCYAVPVVIVSGAEQAEVQARPQRTRRTTASTRPRRRRKVDGFKVEAGQKVWDLGVRLCRRSGYMLWCAPVPERSAGLVVDVPRETGPTVYVFERRHGRLDELAGNMLESSDTTDGSDTPTIVGVFHDAPLDANDDVHGYEPVPNERYLNHPRVAHESTLSGSIIPKHRYLHPEHIRTREDAQKYAERAVAESMFDLDVYEVTVEGWGQIGSDGVRRLYAVNSLARVIDETDEPPLDATYLITSVHFHRSRARGTVAMLRLVPVGAIKVLPLEDP